MGSAQRRRGSGVSGALPSGTRQLLDLLETLQGSDNVHIFPEKLYDNEDNLHSPENRVYSPKELMEMDWLDACVHGKLPITMNWTSRPVPCWRSTGWTT